MFLKKGPRPYLDFFGPNVSAACPLPARPPAVSLVCSGGSSVDAASQCSDWIPAAVLVQMCSFLSPAMYVTLNQDLGRRPYLEACLWQELGGSSMIS